VLYQMYKTQRADAYLRLQYRNLVPFFILWGLS
jgi:hypothetical protein